MTKHNIWSISIIVLLFILLFTPLIVAESLYFPFVTGKVFAFRAIISLALIAWLILVLKQPEYLPKKSTIVYSSGLFVFFLAVSNSLSIDPSLGFFSNFERMEGWFTHLYFFIYLLIISSVFQTEKVWNWFLKTSLAVGNIIGLYVLFDSVSRSSIFLGNSTYLAIYALFNLYVALFLAYRLYKAKVEDALIKYSSYAYYVGSFILLGYMVFRTQTRGTMLGLVFSLALLFALTAISLRKNKKVRTVAISVLALFVIGSGMFWVNRDSSFVQNNPALNRIATISPSEGTAKARLVNWGIAFEGIKEKPVFGWGQETYMYVFAKYYDPDMHAQEPWFDRTHNAFIDWFVQGGVVAFLLYISIFVFALYTIYRSKTLTSIEKNILVSMFVGYIIHNLFVFDNYSSYLLFFSFLGFVVYHSDAKRFVCNWDEKLKQTTAIVLIGATVITAYIVILKPYSVAKDLINVLKYSDAYKILNTYEDVFERNTFGNFEATSRLLSDAGSFSQVQDPKFIQTYREFAGLAAEQAIKEQPNNVRALEFVGTYYLQQGNLPRAIELLERARELAPNRHNNLYLLGYAYTNSEQFEKAKEVFRYAYEQKPEVDKARTYYGGILLLSGEIEEGLELIEGYDYRDPYFLAIFNRTKQYQESVKIMEKQVEQQPENYQLQVTLAMTYFRNNQTTKAVELLRNVINKVPEFKEQGEFMIKEMQAGREPTF